MVTFTEDIKSQILGEFETDINFISQCVNEVLSATNREPSESNFANLFSGVCVRAHREIYNLQVALRDFEAEDEWSFSPESEILRCAFRPLVDVFESWANDRCFELASSHRHEFDFGDCKVAMRRYPGDRDSFGWLVGVHTFTVFFSSIPNAPHSCHIDMSWG